MRFEAAPTAQSFDQLLTPKQFLSQDCLRGEDHGWVDGIGRWVFSGEVHGPTLFWIPQIRRGFKRSYFTLPGEFESLIILSSNLISTVSIQPFDRATLGLSMQMWWWGVPLHGQSVLM